MREQKGLRALGIEEDLYLVVLRDLIAIDAHDSSDTEHTVGNAIIGLP